MRSIDSSRHLSPHSEAIGDGPFHSLTPRSSTSAAKFTSATLQLGKLCTFLALPLFALYLACKDQFCKSCFERYVADLVQNSWGLTVQKIKCPVCQLEISHEEWSRHVSSQVVTKYHEFNQPYRPISRYCLECEGEVTFAELPIMTLSRIKDELNYITKLVVQFCSNDQGLDVEAASFVRKFEEKCAALTECAVGSAFELYEMLFTSLRRYTCQIGRTGSDLAQFGDLDATAIAALAEISQRFIKLESRPEYWREIQFLHIRHFPRVECYTCGEELCFSCGEQGYHEGMSCRESMDRRLDENEGDVETLKWQVENGKRCPKCSILINREEGCNKVDCLYCGHKFCWLCLGEFDKSKCGFYQCQKVGGAVTSDKASVDAGSSVGYRAELGVPDMVSIHSKSLESGAVPKLKLSLKLFNTGNEVQLHSTPQPPSSGTATPTKATPVDVDSSPTYTSATGASPLPDSLYGSGGKRLPNGAPHFNTQSAKKPRAKPATHPTRIRKPPPPKVRDRPLYPTLDRLISQIQQRDGYAFFLNPVDPELVPDYASVIKHPMDLGTMQKKVDARRYFTIMEFKADFDLVVRNAMTYNAPGTIYYRQAKKLKKAGEALIEKEEPYVLNFGNAAVANATEFPIMTPHAGQQADSGSAKPARAKPARRQRQVEELKARLKARFQPDATYHKPPNPWQALPPVIPYLQHLNYNSSLFFHSLDPVLAKHIPRNYLDFGLHGRPQKIPFITQECLQEVYGNAVGRTYVDSLERFSQSLGPRVRQFLASRCDQVTLGAHSVYQQARTFLSKSDDKEGSSDDGASGVGLIKSEGLGEANIVKRLAASRAPKPESTLPPAAPPFSSLEAERIRHSPIDVLPLLKPVVQCPIDPVLATELLHPNPAVLLDGCAKEFAAWKSISSRFSPAQNGGGASVSGPPFTLQEMQLAERIRRRLLQAVQKVPPQDLKGFQPHKPRAPRPPPPPAPTPSPPFALGPQSVAPTSSHPPLPPMHPRPPQRREE